MKIQYCCIVLMGLSITSFSQEKAPSVIAPAGEISKAANLTLEWTVGELAIEALASATALWTQGFHQPLLEVQKLKMDKELVMKNTIHVYPNPASISVTVQLDKVPGNPLLVSLMDVNGKLLQTTNFPLKTTTLKLNVSSLSQGTYILRIAKADGTIEGTYKIIKAQ